MIYWLLQQGWQKMTEINSHLVATDTRAYAMEQRVQQIETHLADQSKPAH